MPDDGGVVAAAGGVDDVVMLETAGAAVLSEAEAERERALAQARLDYAAALRNARLPARFTMEIGAHLAPEVQAALTLAESQDSPGRAVALLHADAVGVSARVRARSRAAPQAALRVYNRCAGVCFPGIVMGGETRTYYLFSAFTPAPTSQSDMETRFPINAMVIMDGYGVPDELPGAVAAATAAPDADDNAPPQPVPLEAVAPPLVGAPQVAWMDLATSLLMDSAGKHVGWTALIGGTPRTLVALECACTSAPHTAAVRTALRAIHERLTAI